MTSNEGRRAAAFLAKKGADASRNVQNKFRKLANAISGDSSIPELQPFAELFRQAAAEDDLELSSRHISPPKDTEEWERLAGVIEYSLPASGEWTIYDVAEAAIAYVDRRKLNNAIDEEVAKGSPPPPIIGASNTDLSDKKRNVLTAMIESEAIDSDSKLTGAEITEKVDAGANFNQFKKSLSEMVKAGFLRSSPRGYWLTCKGRQFFDR